MQDKQVSIHRNDEQALLLRSQRLLEHLENLWQNPQEPSSGAMKQIIVTLPEPYRAMALEAIAERLVNDTKLHFLNIVATFYQKAEQEGIDAEERDETLQDIKLDTFRLMQLSKQISVHSLDDLLVLSNITSGVHALSQVNNAENAQSWMYKLPVLYQSRIEQEHLTVRNFTYGIAFSFDSSDLSTWNTALSNLSKAMRTWASEVHPRRTELLSTSVDTDWANLLPKSVHVNPQINEEIPTTMG
ncbi:MAG TPA: hypothetical protein VEP90_24940 [Methylomirabilota bacterium]|nr:hypothetical protein [Methylomirabilota bacterium]